MGDRATDEAPKGDVAPATHADSPRFGRFWFAGWLSATGLALVALAIAYPEQLWPIAPALLTGAAPAAVSLTGRGEAGPTRQGLLLALWALGGGLACTLAGGVAGPLAAWCLAPAAAAAA
ncbi:MAG: hypothetical protein ACOY4K_04425, partial [Pseudomonadota bacterium]